MLRLPFPKGEHVIAIPEKQRPWFYGARVMHVHLDTQTAIVAGPGGDTYRLLPHADVKDAFQVASVTRSGPAKIGEIHPRTLRRVLTDRHLHLLGLVRSVIYDVPFPTPLAYRMPDKTLVHPGPCYLRHSATKTLNTYYVLKEDGARCSICKESIL